jgi:hypothetical protein
MDFPIVDLFDDDLGMVWLLKYFHQNELRCPHCGKSVYVADATITLEYSHTHDTIDLSAPPPAATTTLSLASTHDP